MSMIFQTIYHNKIVVISIAIITACQCVLCKLHKIKLSL